MSRSTWAWVGMAAIAALLSLSIFAWTQSAPQDPQSQPAPTQLQGQSCWHPGLARNVGIAELSCDFVRPERQPDSPNNKDLPGGSNQGPREPVMTPSAALAELRQLRVENAAADAQSAMISKDFRLVAVRGYSLEVPGTNRAITDLQTQYGIRIIEGTSDAHEGAEHSRLNAIARAYAVKYNEEILKNITR